MKNSRSHEEQETLYIGIRARMLLAESCLALVRRNVALDRKLVVNKNALKDGSMRICIVLNWCSLVHHRK
jgi:hypothetical protein